VNDKPTYRASQIKFFTGDTRSHEIVRALSRHRIGRTVIDNAIKPYLDEDWIFDNGAFRDFKQGKTFDSERYKRAIDMALRISDRHNSGPYFAVIPDIVAGGRKSLDLSLSWIGKMPEFWSKYLVVQNGMIPEDIEHVPPLFHINGIFLGGDDKFKYTAKAWKQWEKQHGLDFHYGRCGTEWKLGHAKYVGADSCDSALPLWRSERLQDLISWLKASTAQGEMWQLYDRDPADFSEMDGGSK
jgi:hypothetical protein